MKLQLAYELDKGLLLEALKTVYRRRFLAVRVYASLLLTAGLVMIAVAPHGWSSLGWILLFGGPLTWLALEFNFRRFAAKHVKVLRGTILTMLDDEAIRQELPTIKSEFKWAAITGVRQSERLWLLMLSPVQGVHIPRAAFDAEATAEFEAFLNRRGLLPG